MADSILPSIFSVWKKLQEKVSCAASSSTPLDVPKLNQLSDMVYEVYTPPEDRPELEIVFFHGLQLGSSKDAYVTTWMSRDNSHLWIQTWLVELFPRARILTVSYDSSAEKTQESGVMDMYCTAENLVSSLIADEVRVGQRGCPVVFVGHCFGGLVLKELCLSAAWMMGRKSEKIPRMERIRHLLSNIRGMFYYGTPHVGSVLGDKLHNYFDGTVLEEMETLTVSSARRNQDFDDLRLKYNWITSGVGETRKTYVEFLGTAVHFVTEASSRQSMDTYYSANTDHYDICKAEGKNSGAVQLLGNFVQTILKSYQVVQAGLVASAKRKQEYFIDLDGRAKQVCSMLARADVQTIFICGLSGIGKTTLARHVYQEIGDNFDVKCFVSLDSIEGQSNGSDQVWRKIRQNLEGIHPDYLQNLPSMLYQMKNKRIFMVLDSVESKSQLDIVRTEDWLDGSSSKLIVTSTTSRFGNPSNTFEVGYLRSEESEKLFCHYAFQDRQEPHDLRDLIQQVIAKCDGYPLFIKILASFVSKDSAIHEKEVWLGLLSRLAKAEDVDAGPDYRLWAKLKVCYDALLPSEQEIFLDIATIFQGFPLSLVKSVWKVSREEPWVAWLNLKSRFLVSVDEHSVVQMHAQLRDLGRRIACPRGENVGKFRRISQYSLTTELREELFSKDKGPMETLALELKVMENESFKLKKSTFHNYDHLQYLILEGGRTSSLITWDKVRLPQSLVYLRWKDGLFTVCPMDFSRLEKLAVVELLDCKSMKSLPPSLLKARRLTWLELQGCSSLSKLPEGLSKRLQYIGLERTGLMELPDDCKSFKEVVVLKVSHTKLIRIPEGLCVSHGLGWCASQTGLPLVVEGGVLELV
ncbi:unnamed protein product [Calypogeia fissa]